MNHTINPKMVAAVILGLAVMLLIVSYGCHVENARTVIEPLEKRFGILWPTNCFAEYGATRSAGHGVFRVARLEMDGDTFLTWKNASADKLARTEDISMLEEPRIKNRYSWWKPTVQPATNVTNFRNLHSDPAHHLFIQAHVETNMVTMFIFALDAEPE